MQKKHTNTWLIVATLAVFIIPVMTLSYSRPPELFRSIITGMNTPSMSYERSVAQEQGKSFVFGIYVGALLMLAIFGVNKWLKDTQHMLKRRKHHH